MKKIRNCGWLVGTVVLLGGTAAAQEPAGTDGEDGASGAAESATDAEAMGEPVESAPPAPAPVPAPAKETSAAGADGGRFRFGVAGGLGILAISGGGGSATFTYTGLDLRLGAQINDLIAVYVQPQLGGYFGGVGGFIGTGGLVGASALVDFTFSDYFFAGAGAGYGILNNPGGVELHFRAGGYPILSRSDESISRKALMVGVDFRIHIVDAGGTSVTGIAPTVNIGYEAF